MSPEKRRGGPGPSRAATAAPVVKRIVLVAMALFTAWHIFASILWIAPPSPAREVVPAGALRGYMLPMFGQSWSVFAPAPINGDYHLDVRAALDAGGGEVAVTEWTRANTAELSYAQHNLFPPRSAGLAVSAASDLYQAYGELSDKSKELVALNFFKDDWSARLESSLAADKTVDTYVAAERTVAAYATQVAYAVWGDDVVRVQYRVSREGIVPFDKRNDPKAVRPEPTVRSTGWRGPLEYEGQSREQFRSYFCSAPARVCP
ncbi:hypothetical protein E4U02_15225 [Microbacterium paludicola]|uniref:Uncharacterized protein n=1 Tax=Microbacterium paludicola TaxID=300019 RepID=A0A4Y9FLC7_9MICO|nr:DUF5819 family protein [Microbacterium paludicola]TFU29964.1 hypothetical protein E4U02_15225 [Microbacterium paludicola]